MSVDLKLMTAPLEDEIREFHQRLKEGPVAIIGGSKRYVIPRQALRGVKIVYAANIRRIDAPPQGKVVLEDLGMLTPPFSPVFNARKVLDEIDAEVVAVSSARGLTLPEEFSVMLVGDLPLPRDPLDEAIRYGITPSELLRVLRALASGARSKQALLEIYRSNGGKAGKRDFDKLLLILAYAGIITYNLEMEKDLGELLNSLGAREEILFSEREVSYSWAQ